MLIRTPHKGVYGGLISEVYAILGYLLSKSGLFLWVLIRLFKEIISANAMAESLMNHDVNEFWKQVNLTTGNRTSYPSTVDGVTGANNIAKLFANKSELLYNSVL